MEQMMEYLLANIYTMHEKIVTHYEEIMADMRAWRKAMKAYQEAAEAYPEEMEANPEEIKSVVVHEEVPKEEAAMKTFRTQERYGNRHLAVGRRR
jgi:hypothetical protein